MERIQKATIVFLWCAIAIATGCAQTATFRQVRPATVELTSRRLALIHTNSRDEGQAAHDALAAALAQTGRDLVDTNELQRFASEPVYYQDGTLNMSAVFQAARRCHVDELLLTRCEFRETDGSVYGSSRLLLGDPEVIAGFNYELFGIQSGRLIDRDSIDSDVYKGDLHSGFGSDSEQDVLRRLAKECGTKVARELTPSEETIEVRLAHDSMGSGATKVREGNRAAREGKWDVAVKHWEAAVMQDNKNDTAWYNLGLGYEATGNLKLAVRAHERANKIERKELYDQANQRAHLALEQVRLANIQLARGRQYLQQQPSLQQQDQIGLAQRPQSGPSWTAQPASDPRAGQQQMQPAGWGQPARQGWPREGPPSSSGGHWPL